MVSRRFSGFLALSLAVHSGLLLFAVRGDSRPLSRTAEVLTVRLLEVPSPAGSSTSSRPPSHQHERITPPKLLAEPKPLPPGGQVEVPPKVAQPESFAPVEPSMPDPVPAASPPAPPGDEVRPTPLRQAAGQPARPSEPAGGTRFAVAAPSTADGGLTLPVSKGGSTSPAGIGAGSGTRGSDTNGSISSFAQPQGGYQVLPRYPESARRQGVQGITELKIHILSDGSVAEVLVARSAGHQELDQAALEAVKRWRFEPARRGDEPVAVWALVPIRFRLD